MYSIVEALMDLARDAGVEFRFTAPVHQINHERGPCQRRDPRRRDSCWTGGRRLGQRGPALCVSRLLPPDGTGRGRCCERNSPVRRSASSGESTGRTRALGPHTLFLAQDYRENFESDRAGTQPSANPSLYLHAPTRIDPSMAPPGQDTLAAIVPVGHLSDDGKQDWQELRDRARDHVFRRLATIGINDLDAHIKFEEAYTPPSWAEHLNLDAGVDSRAVAQADPDGVLPPIQPHQAVPKPVLRRGEHAPGHRGPIAMVSGRLAARANCRRAR